MGHLQAIAPDQSHLDLLRSVCAVNPYGALEDAHELTSGCDWFAYRSNGQAALVALHFGKKTHGMRCNVNAVQTLNPHQPLQFAQIMTAIEHHAKTAGADILTLSTQHPAIAKSAHRWGGQITGVVLSKPLGCMA